MQNTLSLSTAFGKIIVKKFNPPIDVTVCNNDDIFCGRPYITFDNVIIEQETLFVNETLYRDFSLTASHYDFSNNEFYINLDNNSVSLIFDIFDKTKLPKIHVTLSDNITNKNPCLGFKFNDGTKPNSWLETIDFDDRLKWDSYTLTLRIDRGDDDDDIAGWAIALIVIVCIAVVACAAALAIWYIIKKKKASEDYSNFNKV